MKGGNAVAVITQKLLEDKQTQPKLQVLIYPKTQMVNLKLPSIKQYYNSSFTSHRGSQYISWYLGITERDMGYQEFLLSLEDNKQLSLVENQALLNKYKSYMDPEKIPMQCNQNLRY